MENVSSGLEAGVGVATLLTLPELMTSPVVTLPTNITTAPLSNAAAGRTTVEVIGTLYVPGDTRLIKGSVPDAGIA